MAQTIYSIFEELNGNQTGNIVKTVSPLTLTTELSKALVYTDEPECLSAATYLNSLGNSGGVYYVSVGRPDDRKPH